MQVRRLSHSFRAAPPFHLHAFGCTQPLFRQAYDDIEHFETAYVVKLFKFHPLAPTQARAWRFARPFAVAADR